MKVHCTDGSEGSRLWRNQEGLHIDVRGLEPPAPMVAILGLIDSGEVEGALIAHLDGEPIFLYPELEDRNWNHELVPPCGGGDCSDDVKLRMVRWGPG